MEYTPRVRLRAQFNETRKCCKVLFKVDQVPLIQCLAGIAAELLHLILRCNCKSTKLEVIMPEWHFKCVPSWACIQN